jgi:hypothetical protein
MNSIRRLRLAIFAVFFPYSRSENVSRMFGAVAMQAAEKTEIMA